MRSFQHASGSLARLSAFVILLYCAGTAPLSAGPVVALPAGAPVIPSVIPNGVLFELTAPGLGTLIPRYGLVPAADTPVTGGICGTFITGEICPTLEPGIGFGVRNWETIIANPTAGLERFIAYFYAPGLFRAYRLNLPPGGGFYADLHYFGPTIPLWGVFSFLPFTVEIATSITDPLPPLPLDNISFFGGGALDTGTDQLPVMGDEAIPEPGTAAMLGAALILAVWRMRRRAG